MGKPTEVLNNDYLINKWNKAKETSFDNDPFIKIIKKASTKEYNKIIEYGDKELNDSKVLFTALESNLFFKEILGQYLCKEFDNFETEKMMVQSNLFNKTILESDLTYSKTKEDSETITFKKMSTLDKSKIDEKDLIKQYNELYKPKIQFNFSEYDCNYTSIITFCKNDNLIIKSNISVSEEIKNNVSFSVNFSLNRADL